MEISGELRLVIELLGLFLSAGAILYKIGRVGEKINQHGDRLDGVDKAIEKLEETLQTVAVQKDQIQSIRDTIQQNTKRTDETFKRIFDNLDDMRKSP